MLYMTKQKGGSPASDAVMKINSGYLKALAESPIGGRVAGIPCQKGGSPASARVHSLLGKEGCATPEIPKGNIIDADPSKLVLYQTTGGGSKRRRSQSRSRSQRRRQKKSRSQSQRRRQQKSRSRSQRAGGSDFVSTLYSRGPVNYPDNPDMFKKFAGPYDEYISNEKLYYEGLQDGSASNYAPFPFPQKGGKSKSKKHVKKSKSKSKPKKHVKKSKSKSSSKSKSKSNRRSGHKSRK